MFADFGVLGGNKFKLNDESFGNENKPSILRKRTSIYLQYSSAEID